VIARVPSLGGGKLCVRAADAEVGPRVGRRRVWESAPPDRHDAARPLSPGRGKGRQPMALARGRVVYAVVGSAWAAALAFGLARLWTYESTPDAAGRP